MAVSINNRKRSRSQDDYDYTIQSKQFINEQTVAKNSQTKMKEIHGKLNFIFTSIQMTQSFLLSFFLSKIR